MLVHRYSYTMNVGPIAKGLFVCHKCDTPLCVRPDHLFLGSQQENLDDMARKGRRYQKPTLDYNTPGVCMICQRETWNRRQGRCSACLAYYHRHGKQDRIHAQRNR